MRTLILNGLSKVKQLNPINRKVINWTVRVKYISENQVTLFLHFIENDHSVQFFEPLCDAWKMKTGVKYGLFFLINLRLGAKVLTYIRFRDHPISTYAKFFRKTNISHPLIRTNKCAYQGVRNVSFSVNLACVLNDLYCLQYLEPNQLISIANPFTGFYMIKELVLIL